MMALQSVMVQQVYDVYSTENNNNSCLTLNYAVLFCYVAAKSWVGTIFKQRSEKKMLAMHIITQ